MFSLSCCESFVCFSKVFSLVGYGRCILKLCTLILIWQCGAFLVCAFLQCHKQRKVHKQWVQWCISCYDSASSPIRSLYSSSEWEFFLFYDAISLSTKTHTSYLTISFLFLYILARGSLCCEIRTLWRIQKPSGQGRSCLCSIWCKWRLRETIWNNQAEVHHLLMVFSELFPSFFVCDISIAKLKVVYRKFLSYKRLFLLSLLKVPSQLWGS